MRTAPARLTLPALLLPLLFACTLLVACTGPARAQEPAPGDPAVVTAQERNALRAKAYKASNEGRYGDAADAFVALTEAEPDRLTWAVEAGRCLGRSGRFREAVGLLDAARKRFPDDPELETMLARTLLLQSEREEGVVYPEVLWADAAGFAEGVLKVDPDHAEARLLAAQARYLLGQWDEAVRHAEEAARRHPDRAGAHVLLGRIATDRFARLLAEHERLQPTGQEEADLVGRISRQRKAAREAYERAAALDPTRAHPHVMLSQLAEMDGKSDRARAHLKDALTIDPDVPVQHELLTAGMDWEARAAFYRELRARFVAETRLDAAQSTRKAATLWFHEGRALLDGLRFADARKAFDQALTGNPDDKNAHYYAFLCAYYLDDHDAAERHAATYAAKSAPAFADVLRSLTARERTLIAAMVQYLGDRAYQQERIEASRDLNHVIACLKDSADAWNNHAFLCRETGRFEQAYQSYLHAIEKEPGSPQLWNDAGVILQYHLPSPENLAKAREMYEKALALAAKVLDDASSDEAARAFATEARKNAEANLKELPRAPAAGGGGGE